MSPDISFVIPVFNEHETLEELVTRIAENIPQGRTHEVLLIDDGSTDGSGEEIDRLSGIYPEVKPFHFDGNFGKTAGLQCGFDHAQGTIVFTMDADLQDDPVDIPRFLTKFEDERLDLVSGWRRNRHDPWSKRALSKIYNLVQGFSSGIAIHDFNCGFKCYRSSTARDIPLFSDMHRFMPWLAKKRGHSRIGEVEVTHHARTHGHGKYGLKRCWNGLHDYLRILTGMGFPQEQERLYRLKNQKG